MAAMSVSGKSAESAESANTVRPPRLDTAFAGVLTAMASSPEFRGSNALPLRLQTPAAAAIGGCWDSLGSGVPASAAEHQAASGIAMPAAAAQRL